MRLFARQSIHKLATVLAAIVLLQFAGANLGAHQLHLGDHDEEAETHPHLQFTADVTTLAQCLDCSCAFDEAGGLTADVDPNPDDPHSGEHRHMVNKTESKSFDLCLDCQCHGGHVTAMSFVSLLPSVPVGDALTSLNFKYLPPEPLPDYRPPIA